MMAFIDQEANEKAEEIDAKVSDFINVYTWVWVVILSV